MMRRILAAAVVSGLLCLAPRLAYAACSSPVGTAGELRWFSSDRTFKYCDDTTWLGFGRIQSTYYGTSAMFSGGTVPSIYVIGSFSDVVGLAVWDSSGTPTIDDGNGVLYWGDNAEETLRFAFAPEGQPLSEKMRLTTQGELGIGTTMPRATLDVNGYARLRAYSGAPVGCSTSYKGSIALTSSTRMCVCDGTSWKEVNSATGCTW